VNDVTKKAGATASAAFTPAAYRGSVQKGLANVKYATDRPFADPEVAARRLLEIEGIVRTIEPIQDGRIHVEKINGPFLSQEGASPAEYKAGLELAVARGWLWKHESGTFVKFTPAGADLFA
jgi:hypothetical protein